MTDVIPDYIEPLIAYRAFDLREGVLAATSRGVIWDREMVAACGRGHRHASPDPACDCGLWSLKHWGDTLSNFPGLPYAYGKIEVYGRVFEGELTGYGPGYKSEKARILEIYVHHSVPDEDRIKLVDRYGVPVLDTPPLPRIDALTEAVRYLEVKVRTFVANYEHERAREALESAAKTLGRVEKWDALKSRAHAYAYIMQGRNKLSRPLCNNTWLELDHHLNPTLRLHQTRVATYTPDGLELDTGSWYTVTTKDRINMACRACTNFSVYSDGVGGWAAYKSGHWSVGNDQPIPPWLEGVVDLTPDGMRTDQAVEGEQMTLEGDSVPIFVAAKVSKRTEKKLRREWLRQNGWEIPFSNGMILPYKETT